MSGTSNTFSSKIFDKQLRTVNVAGITETVLTGERKFNLLKEAFKGIEQIAVIGWSSQGPAQAQNLRESLKDTDIKVVVGLREGSGSRKSAQQAGFTVENGTLTDVETAVKGSDLSLLLISDAAMAERGKELIDLAPSGATIGLSHGFFIGHQAAAGKRLRSDVDIIGVCPKGMGPSVRRLYEQGSGINASFAVEQGGQKALDRALGWALGIGAPYTFQSTLGNEWRSDVTGERAILLGEVHGIVEAMYAWKQQHGQDNESSYVEVVESLVGPISSTISHEGLGAVYEKLDKDGQQRFRAIYNAAYPVLKELTQKVYNDVSSGRELMEVVADNEAGFGLSKVDATQMWRVGAKVREDKLDRKQIVIDPEVAGLYIAGMVAQADVLRGQGHHWSEVVNESIIEAVDSLNPYMKARGVSHMIDNCSITARRGARKWAPQYRALIDQSVLPVIDGYRKAGDHDYTADFLKHDVHRALKVLSAMRPSIDIAVT